MADSYNTSFFLGIQRDTFRNRFAEEILHRGDKISAVLVSRYYRILGTSENREKNGECDRVGDKGFAEMSIGAKVPLIIVR